jgi:hypothetical protein
MNDKKELNVKDAMLAHIEQVIGMPIKFVPGDGENTPSGEI